MREGFRTEKELETGSTPADHRSRFAQRLEQEQRTFVRSNRSAWISGFSLAAATVGAVLAISMLFSGEPENGSVAMQKFNPITAMNERAVKLEQVYMNHVQAKIPVLLEHEPVLAKQVQLLERLEQEYMELKALFIASEGNETITKEMIRNHKLRLQLMEQMLHQIELMKSKKSNQNEIKSA